MNELEVPGVMDSSSIADDRRQGFLIPFVGTYFYRENQGTCQFEKNQLKGSESLQLHDIFIKILPKMCTT